MLYELEYITKFRVIRQIALGGMGAIYLAEQLGANNFRKMVVIKTIRSSLITDSETLDMFIGEAKLVADLIHENIVQVYQFEQNEGIYFLVMEYAEGPNLDNFLDRHRFMKKPVPVDLAAFIISRIARGLNYAHKKRDHKGNRLKIVHRDISPANVIITYQGVVKLTDFGIAKVLTLKVPDEREVLMGKYPYMSPEQARFEETDPRSDIFSLGLVAYEVLTGTSLFEADNVEEVLKEMEKTIDPLHITHPPIPEQLSQIVMKCLSMEPENRYLSAKDLRADLEYFLYHKGLGPTNENLANYVELLFPEHKKKTGIISQNW